LDAFAKERIGLEHEDWIVGLAVLCHDFGKPTTTTFTDVIRSIGHDKAGEEPTRAFLNRITDENGIADAVVSLVVNHLKPHEFFKSKASASAIRRLANKVRLDRLVRVSFADQKGVWGAKETKETAEWLINKAKELTIADSAPKPIMKGRHLIALKKRNPNFSWLVPGPNFGRVLAACFEAQLDGEFTDEVEGIQFVENKDWSQNE
jgi:tRNA nucleotidyltransferase (CCA-adding enzyme)